MKGRSEESVLSLLNRPDLEDWVREDLEAELDWIRRGRPEDELIPEYMIERMTVEAGGPIPARFKHLQHLNGK